VTLPLIALRSAGVSFGAKQALRGVDLSNASRWSAPTGRARARCCERCMGWSV
jgi:hypothetical protein